MSWALAYQSAEALSTPAESPALAAAMSRAAVRMWSRRSDVTWSAAASP